MKKIFVLGSRGMLGHVVSDYLRTFPDEYIIYNLARNIERSENGVPIDLLDFELLKETIVSLRPDVIINCVGLLVKNSIDKPSLAILTNSYLPHFLNETSYECDYKLIHISTDCVFSGKKGSYLENDFKDETNYYGLSKNLGEIINDKNLTIRTSIIGPELKPDGSGLFQWFMNQRNRDVVKGYTKAIWSGLTTLELSRFIHHCIVNDYSGLLHATNNDSISKYELLNLIKAKFKLSVDIEPSCQYEIDKSIKMTKEINYQFPNYEYMIKEMAEWINLRPELYDDE
ncbi:SDR family oxidoreductase [Verrucomicrobia bacterium]|nr:SDR family oxidoreductase [Verrucomicrobiota bacterium]